MTTHDPNLYDELGVAPGASDADLRAGYRQRARQLHPDVAPEADTGDAMRRLNQAWAVLGDPEQRRRYDEEQAGGAGAPGPGPAPPGEAVPETVPPGGTVPTRRRHPFVRPSAIVLTILAVLFVVTAYAGSWPGNQSSPPTTTPSPGSSPPAATQISVVGRCLAGSGTAGLNTIVVCSYPNGGQIMAEVAAATECPAGTVGHSWTLRPTVLCATAPSQPAP